MRINECYCEVTDQVISTENGKKPVKQTLNTALKIVRGKSTLLAATTSICLAVINGLPGLVYI